jgi:hypothetical protein
MTDMQMPSECMFGKENNCFSLLCWIPLSIPVWGTDIQSSVGPTLSTRPLPELPVSQSFPGLL